MGLINIYNSVSAEHKTIKGNGKLRDILPEYDFSHTLILKAGNRLDSDYVVTEEDVLYIRAVPGSTTTIALIGVVVAVVAAGVAIGYTYKNNQALKNMMESSQRKSSQSDLVEQLPFIRGAKNRRALGNSIQYVIGETYNSPYLATDGYYSIDGVDGVKQYWNSIMCAGYGKQIVKELYCGNELLQRFSDTEAVSGVFGTLESSIYHEPENLIEIAQGNEFQNNWFRQKVKGSYIAAELKNEWSTETDSNKEYNIQQCDMYTQKVEVCVEFPALRYYSEDAEDWVRCGVTVTPEWSNGEVDEDGNVIWHEFTFAAHSEEWKRATTEEIAQLIADKRLYHGVYGGYISLDDNIKITNGNVVWYWNVTEGNYISRNTRTTVRFMATKEFSAEEAYGKTISVRLSRSMKYKSNSQEDCYFLFMNCFCYDNVTSTATELKPCKVLKDSSKLTMLGIHFVASDSTQGLLDELNIITTGTAKKITANGFGDYEGTQNPVSWIAEILTSETHLHSVYTDEELDMPSFYEAWEYTENKGYKVGGIVNTNIKKRDLLTKLLFIINGTLFFNADGKLEIAIDKEESTPVALLNSECIKSVTYAKEFTRNPDGLKLTFTNKDTWAVDTRYVMADGKDEHTTEDLISERNIEFVTDPDVIYMIGLRQLKEKALQPLTITADIGREGDYYPLYSLVLVQIPQLHQGLASSVISKVITDGQNRIVSIEISDLIEFDGKSSYGVIIQSGTSIHYAEVTGTGATRTLNFTDSLDLSSLSVGDHVSFGYLNEDGSFDKVAQKMKIYGIARSSEGGVKLTLKPYNEELYTLGEIPTYNSNLTKPVQPQRGLPALTQQDLNDAMENSRTVKTIQVFYALSQTTTPPAKGSFTTDVPVMTSEYRYLWSYTRYIYKNDSQSDTAIVMCGAYGEQGLPGSGYMLDISPDSTTVFADLNGAATVPSVQFGAYLFNDATDISASSTFKAYINNQEVGSWDNNIVTIPTSAFAEDSTQIKISATYGSITRTGFATLTKVFGTTFYQLLPSTQTIKVQQNGEIVPSLVTVTKQKITSSGYYQAGDNEGVVYGRTLPGGTLQKIGYFKVEAGEQFDESKQYCTETEPFMLSVATESGSGADIVIGDEENNAIIFYTRKEA